MQAAHAKNLKVLFDYAMVHVHTESAVYKQHKNDSPAGSRRTASLRRDAGCGNYDNDAAGSRRYLAHYDYTNSGRAHLLGERGRRSSSRRTATTPSASTPSSRSTRAGSPRCARPITSQILASEMPQQRFYMVGETYDFQNRGLIASLIDSATKLDGQFDFPLRIRLVEAVLDAQHAEPAHAGRPQLEPQRAAGDDGARRSSWTRTTRSTRRDAVMSTFIGNHDLPRSIHYAEQTLPGWLGAARADRRQEQRVVEPAGRSRPTRTPTSASPTPSP